MVCDVVEMDACHVLLGTLWLFDRNIVHDVRKIHTSLTRMDNDIVKR